MKRSEAKSIAPPDEPSIAPPLPLEVIENILSFVPRVRASQPTLHACTLVSRVWYAAAIGRLYAYPRITGRSYDKFTKSICPSINAHIRKNGLAELVRVLDLSVLVHHGSKSLTARLLGRVKAGLEKFIAPQASFGINALAALSKCARLRYLDLSLVSEAFPPQELSHTLQSLQSLETLRFPRAGSQTHNVLLDCLPEGLRECVVTGGVRSWSHEDTRRFSKGFYPRWHPYTLTRLIISNCDQLQLHDIECMVVKDWMPNLEYLKVEKQMTRIRGRQFGGSLLGDTNIRHLWVPLDCLSLDFWTGDESGSFTSCLDTLELDYPRSHIRLPSGSRLDFDLIFDKVADGNLRNLRRLGLHRALAQKLGTVKESEFLNEYLKALAREDEEGAKYSEDQAGIWLFGEDKVR